VLVGLFAYDAPIPASQKWKPVQVSCGVTDPSFPPKMMKAVAASFAGPVEFRCTEEASRQLMLFQAKNYSRGVRNWALRQL